MLYRVCVLAMLALSSGYQLVSPRASMTSARCAAPVAGLLDGVFGSAAEAKNRQDAVAARELEAMKEMQEKRRARTPSTYGSVV